MDKEKAKSFLFDAIESQAYSDTIFRSKDLQKLLDKNNGKLTSIYAIIDTESGEILMNMDWSYSGEPIIMGRFFHLESFLKYHWDKKVIDLDK